MGSGASGPGPTWPPGSDDDEAAQTPPDYEPTRRSPDFEPTWRSPDYQPTWRSPDYEPAPPSPDYEPTPPSPGYEPTQASLAGATTDRTWPSGSPEIVRYGPGVPDVPPANQAGLTAEHVWRTGRSANGPAPHRRPTGLRRVYGTALTVILLAASGVLLYLRFHHAPFHVTRVAISHPTQNGCGADVTGHITTNGSAGTVSYQWVFRPDPNPPRPLSQSVVAGQHDVYVTVAVEGQGQGTASQTVTLQVLGPDPKTASTSVVVSC